MNPNPGSPCGCDLYLKQRHACRPDRSYLISGGLGGLGLALAAWLAQRGARFLALTSRRGVRSGEQRRALDALRASGVQVGSMCVECSLRNSMLS